MIRVQKLISETGYCSRRKAEELISQGKVEINGKTIKLGDKANPEDIIFINKKAINTSLPKKRYFLVNKPIEYVSTTAIFKNEKNIFELLPKELKNFKIAGRLDKDSSGLLLLTNDGDLVQKITHPSFKHTKTYIVEINNPKRITAHQIIQAMKNGIDIGEDDKEEIVKAKKITVLKENTFELVISQGKKRQIRRMFEAVNCRVSNLQRTKIANLEIGDLRSGKYREIKKPILK